MKKLHYLFSAFILISSSVKAQNDPAARLFMDIFWQDIMPNDSLAFSSDTGASWFTEATTAFYLFPNGHPDSTIIYDFGSPTTYYDGIVNGTLTEITEYNINAGNSPVSKYDFEAGSSGRDTSLTISFYNGAIPVPVIRFGIEYTNNQVSKAIIHQDTIGGGPMVAVNDYVMHYSSGLLDSVQSIDLASGEVVFTLINTRQGGLLTSSLIDYRDNTLDDDEYYTFLHNAQNEINQVMLNSYDSINNQWEVDYTWKYFKRVNSNISIRETEGLSLNLYPNPVKDHLMIEGITGKTQYSLLDLSGRTISTGEMDAHNHRLETSLLKPGIYIIRFQNEMGLGQLKFLKE